MDFSLLVFVCLIVGVFSAPQYGEEEEYHHHHSIHELKTTPIPILQHKSERHKEGYQFSYKTGNGIHAEEAGYVKKTGEKEDDSIVVMHGSVSYTGPDGVPVKLTYVADEHGFQPQGAHLPTPPPIPLELQKAYEKALEQHHQVHQQQHEVHQHQQELAYDDEPQFTGHYQ